MGAQDLQRCALINVTCEAVTGLHTRRQTERHRHTRDIVLSAHSSLEIQPNSEFGMHQQRYLGELWPFHCTMRKFLVDAAENGLSKVSPNTDLSRQDATGNRCVRGYYWSVLVFRVRLSNRRGKTTSLSCLLIFGDEPTGSRSRSSGTACKGGTHTRKR